MPVYTRAHKRKLQKVSRTLPIFGKGDDDGKYFHCWHCGFVCDKDRDELGDSASKGGDKHLVALISIDNGPGGNTSNRATLGGCIGHYHVAAKIGPDGEPDGVKHNYMTNIIRGCPSCGSTNWRGDY
jgi:hypothetical protein